jgi:UDP-N-acetylglucosamine diphosphorylase/glucosamine-1-phosphate N-acetyltransferase
MTATETPSQSTSHRILVVREQHPENFGPLALTRATFELRYGALCPLDRAIFAAEAGGARVVLQARPELAAYLRAKTGLPVNEDHAELVGEREEFPGLPYLTPWEILAHSNELIAADYDEWARTHHNYRRTSLMPGAHIVGSESDVHIGAHSVVQPGCVLDASGGPIIIGPDVQVKFSQIQGPVYVGKGCVVDGARLRPGTSLGPNCKVGGEISATIFQSRVNKGHEGFVGHTWAGRWVNFGALATTSNLKNTYGSIRWQRDQSTVIDTGVQFLGSLIGDHTKIGIGQMLNTGSNIGVGCNIFGGGVAPKYIPSFSWGGLAGWNEHRLDDCLKTVNATLSRRNARLRPESEAVLRAVFEDTRGEREWFFGGK